jgi:putative flippase GtrA
MSVAISLIQLHYLIAQVIATGIVLIWNFLGNRIWTFRASAYGNTQKV